jgi:DNA-binding transcriptional ArsR family regulator
MAKSRSKPARVPETVRYVTDILGLACEPRRLLTVLMLERGELHSGAIGKALGKRPAEVGHHLALLRHGKVVADRREGRRIYYGLTEAGRVLAEAVRNLGDYLR